MDPSPVSEERASPVPQLVFGFVYFPLLVDLGLRVAVLTAWRYALMPAWLFWLLQAPVISLGITVWTYNRRDSIAKRYGIARNAVQQKTPALAGWFGCAAAAYGSYQIVRGLPPIHSAFLHSLLAIVLVAAYLFYVLMIFVGSLSAKPIEDLSYDNLPNFEPVDENDRQLVRLQTEVAVFERRVESYTIESVLIGGLAFSAFVTIVASDAVSALPAGDLFRKLSDTGRTIGKIGTLSFRWDAVGQALMQLLTGPRLLEVISCLALMCSILFLAVIVGRLRFNSLVGVANYSALMASTFNDKEEEVDRILQTTASDDLRARMRVLQGYIATSLAEGNVALDQLRPIVAYMGIFRHLGVVTFLATLVASAMWFSPVLALGFFGVGVVAYAYPALDHWLRDKAIRKLTFFLIPGEHKRP